MSTAPAFASAPITKVKLLSAANLNFDGTGTIVDLLSGTAEVPAAGTKVSTIKVIAAQAAIAACVIRLFLHDGTSYFLYDEISISAVTGSATAIGSTNLHTESDLIVPSGYKLAASISVAQNMNIQVRAGTLT